jgi:hypothetical protein
MKGIDVMRAKILALTVGVVMLDGAGTAYADAVGTWRNRGGDGSLP